MKNVMLICSLFLAFALNAQPRGEQRGSERQLMKDATPEEIATLRSKKLTLDLDLSQAQQEQVKALELKRAKMAKTRMADRKEKHTLSKEELIALKSQRLDMAIAHKREMKAILNASQYEEWEKRKGPRGRIKQKRGKKGKEKDKRGH